MLACVPEAILTWQILELAHPPARPIAGRNQETQAVAKTKTSTKSKSPARQSKAASHKSKTSTAKRGPKGRSAGEKEVTLDRRRGKRREEEKPAAAAKPTAPPVKLERRAKVNRRRQIDPTTCERDYTDHEVEFMNALDDYKRKSGRMFPTCSEVLEVVRSLGYVRLTPTELASRASVQGPELTLVSVAVEEETTESDWQ
jgi:hypothetical protein